MSYLQQVTEQRAALYAKAKAMLDTAANEKRELSTREQSTYAEMTKDLAAQREMIEHLNAKDARTNASSASLRALAELPVDSRSGYQQHSAADIATNDEFRSAILEHNPKPIEVFAPAPRSYYQPGVEARALAKTSPIGFQPVALYNKILDNLVETTAVLRAGAMLINTSSGEDLRIPRATALSSAGLVAEGAIIPEADPTLSSVTLGAYKYAVLITVSNEMVEDDSLDIGGYLAREAGIALGNALGNHLINGNGTGQPRGVLMDATLGVTAPVGCATSLGAQGTGGMGTDLLNSLVGSLAEPYTRSRAAGFLTRTGSLAAVRNLKSTQGELVGNEYLANAPAPFLVDPFVASMGANAKSFLYGDWSRFYVRMVNGVRFEQSRDYAWNTDQTTFRVVLRADGALIDPSAIKYLANSAT